MTLLWLATAWLVGVAAAAADLALPWPFVVFAGLGVSVGFLLAGHPRHAALVTACLALAIAGSVRFTGARPPENPGGIAVYNDRGPVTIVGVVVGEPEEAATSRRIHVSVEAASAGDGGMQPTSGQVLVTTRPFPALDYGDRVRIEGKLITPPVLPSFDYRDYLARRGIVSLAVFPTVERFPGTGGSTAGRLLSRVRGRLGSALENALPEPEAALARGILLGQRASIPTSVTDDFNASGISHLVAISGYNVTLVAGLAVTLFAWLVGRRPATFLAMAAVIVFVLLVGASPSVLRAAVMGIVMLGATFFGRPASGLTAIAFAAALLTAWQPLSIQDVSFQLSFAATLGLLLAARPLGDRLSLLFGRLFPDSLASPLAEAVSVTAAASLAALPIVAADFGRVSLVAVPANLFAVPAFPFILLTSALAAIGGAILPFSAGWLGQVAYLPLRYLIDVGRLFATVPAASPSIPRAGLPAAAAMYAGLGIAGWLLLVRRPAPRLPSPATPVPRFGLALPAAVLLLALAGLTLRDAVAGGGDRLRVTVLDVGQGDAILIQTPAGQRVLVDGGPSESVLLQALAREMPSTDRRIDLLVSTHPQADHLTGLVGVLQRYQVGSVIASPKQADDPLSDAWRSALADRGLRAHEAVAGDSVDLGDGVRLDVLGPPPVLLQGTPDDLNANSVVFRLVYGDVSFLLPGDLNAAGEQALLAAGVDLHSTVLKLAHHGSDGSSSPEFLTAVRPAVAAISVGAENDFGHPSPSTLLRLPDIPIFRTDRNGRLGFETDGEKLWTKVDRGAYQMVAEAVH